MEYKSYWKSEFQQFLEKLKEDKIVCSWKEISCELEGNEIPINEFVYRVSLRNPSASIVIFSSVDKITERTRDHGRDAVRVIYEWKTKKGLIYSKIKKRNRIETLFDNLHCTIAESAKKCFDLKSYTWVDLRIALS